MRTHFLKRILSAVTGAAMLLPVFPGAPVSAAETGSEVEVNFAKAAAIVLILL